MLLKLLKTLVTWAALVIVLLMGTAAGWLASSSLRGRSRDDPLRPGLSIERLKEFAELTTLRIEVSDVLVSRIDGYTGGVQAVLLVKGDVDLNVDMNKAKLKDVDEERHTAVVVLSPPRASRPRVDHSRTQIVSLSRDGLWIILPGSAPYRAVTDQAMAESQLLVAGASEGQEVDTKARQHVEEVLDAGCRALGWTISIEWTDREGVDG